MNTNPTAKVLKRFGGMPIGFIFRPKRSVARNLQRGGYIELIDPQDAVPKVKAEVNLPRRSKAQRKVPA